MRFRTRLLAGAGGDTLTKLLAGKLEEALDSTPAARPGFDYAASGGWVAFTKTVGPQTQVWTRSPTKVRALASPFAKATIAGVNPSGEVVVDALAHRYLSSAGATLPTVPLDLGAPSGTMIWKDGAWYELAKCVLYRVGGASGGGDAGAPSGDAGSSGDAGASGGDGGAPSGAPDGGAPPSGEGGGGAGGSAAADPGSTDPTEDSATGGSCTFATTSKSGGLSGALLVLLAVAAARRRLRSN